MSKYTTSHDFDILHVYIMQMSNKYKNMTGIHSYRKKAQQFR